MAEDKKKGWMMTANDGRKHMKKLGGRWVRLGESMEMKAREWMEY